MNRQLQDIDELFRSALSAHEVIPSSQLRQNLFNSLEISGPALRKKIIPWKKAALILSLLLASITLYESAFIHEQPAGTVNNKSLVQKRGPSSTPVQYPVDKTNHHRKKIFANTTDNPENQQQEKTKRKSSINLHSYFQPTSTFVKTVDILNKDNSGTKELNLFPEAWSSKPNPLPDMTAGIDPILKLMTMPTQAAISIHHFHPYWTLMGTAVYDCENYRLDSDQPNALRSIQHREVHEPSYSIGVLVARQFKEHWGLQTGIVFSNTAIGISPHKLYALQDPSGNIAYKYTASPGYTFINPGFGASPTFGDSITATEAKHILRSLSLPVMIKYSIGRNKFHFIPGAGVEANFITKAKLEIEIEDAVHRETLFINRLQGTKSFYWSFVADADLRFTLNKNFSIGLRPVFRYALTSITENNVVETFPYSLGLSMGVTYKF